MTDIIKDVEAVASVATGGLGIQSKLILGLGGFVLASAMAVGLAEHFENKGRVLERAEWLAKQVKEQAADAALIAQHQQEMNELEQHHLLIERQTSEDHEKELATLRTARSADRAAVDAAGGLRIPAPAAIASSGVVAGTQAAGSGGRDDSSASTVRLPQSIEDGLWGIADDADEVSAQLRACQSWIKANGFYGIENAERQGLLGKMISSPNQNTEEPNGD